MALTICSCILSIKDMLGNAFSTAELVVEPRKSMVNSGDGLYISRQQRVTASPGIIIQNLLYISKSVSPTTAITITYTGGGVAGSEVVTVIGSDISVQIESGVSTATQIKTAVTASSAALALVYVIISGTGSIVQVTTSSTSLSSAYCYLPLAETTTDSQQVIFTLNYDEAGKTSGSIIFDPISIPNQAVLDLSTILTVSRG